MSDILSYTIPSAIQELFNVRLSDHEAFRNSINTLVTPPFFELKSEQVSHAIGGRKHKHLPKSELTKLYNAVLIQAIFPTPKIIRKIFEDTSERHALTQWAKDIFIDRQSVLGIGLLNTNVHHFFETLNSLIDLTENKLPNPFETLPQTQLNGITSLCQALSTQASSLSQADCMMAHFLNHDLEKAAKSATLAESGSPIIRQYRDMIIRKYEEATAFNKLLDDWRE